MWGNLEMTGTTLRPNCCLTKHWSGRIRLSLVVALLFLNNAGAGTQSYVNGYVVVPVRTVDDKSKEIALPGARVFLVDQRSRDSVAATESDLSGRFNLKTTTSGVFNLCIEADGFDRQCDRREFQLKGSVHRVGHIRLFLKRDPDARTARAWGKVELRDGSTIRRFAPNLGVNNFGTVELLRGKKSVHKAYINNFNEYVIPVVPLKEDFVLRVTTEKERVDRLVDQQTLLQANQDYGFHISLNNTPPELRMVSAMIGNKPVQEAIAGQDVVLQALARDHDKDNLRYFWQLPGDKIVGPGPDAKLQWRAPTRKGRYEIKVTVGDDRGGYDQRAIEVVVGDNRIPFNGVVVNTQDQPISGAQVDINGRLFHTDLRGRLHAEVPVSDRYVFTVRKDGVTNFDADAYGTASFVYRGAVLDGRWVLRLAQVFTVDPSQPIVLRQSAKFRDCVDPRSAQIDWRRYQNPRLFEWQNGNGQALPISDVATTDGKRLKRVAPLIGQIDPSLLASLRLAATVTAPNNENARRRTTSDVDYLPRTDRERAPCTDGIKVEIPPNALVDQVTGQAPAGKLRVALSSVEVNASLMPGDWSASDSSNNEVSMESFGAGSIEIGDGFRRFNLAQGKEAVVSIPIDRSQLAGGASLLPKIPFLYFNEATGVWEQDGEAELVGSGGSALYVKKVSHFSNVNADILKQGESCVAVEYDPGAGFTPPLDIEINMQPSVVNPDVIQVRTITRTNLDTFAIYNLPNDSDIAITPIINGTQPDGGAGPVPAGVFIVNTGGPQTSPNNNPIPNADGSYYSESGGVATGPCGSRVVLTNLVAPEPATGFEFLQGLYQQSSNITELQPTSPAVAQAIVDGAIDYYDQVDPRDKRNSFNLFKSENDFGEPFDPGEVEWDSQFANSGDLGFGRDMHCRRNVGGDGQFDYACFVTNYGQPPLDLPDQVDADNAHAGLSPDATVAMEYSRVENPAGDLNDFPDNDRAVKFYVYNTNAPDDPPLTKADLDNFGERPIPQLCVICHGGQTASVAADPANPTGPKKGAFVDRADIMSMNSSFLPFDLGLYNFPTANPKVAQQAAFKGLNEDIVRGVASAATAAGGPGAEIVELIDEFYAGGVANQVVEPVVTDWDKANLNSDTNRFYREVFGPTCRTCHISQPYSAPPYGRASDFHSDILTIQNRVCNQKVMPHAKRTHQVFWNSLNPSMPGFLQLYGQVLPGWLSSSGSQCGQFYQAGTSVVSVYATEIQPILESRCSSCHSAVGIASGTSFIVGTVADTYSDLIANGMVTPSDLAGSPLFQRLNGVGGQLMPLGGPDLETTDEDVDGTNDQDEIENWILSGAPGP